MARSFAFPAMYLPLIESYIGMALHDVEHDTRVRAKLAKGERRGFKRPVPDRLIDETLSGTIIIVPVPDSAVMPDVAEAERNRRIAALVASPKFSMYPSRTQPGVTVIESRGQRFCGSSVQDVLNLACGLPLDPLPEVDMGDHLHAMGAAR